MQADREPVVVDPHGLGDQILAESSTNPDPSTKKQNMLETITLLECTEEALDELDLEAEEEEEAKRSTEDPSDPKEPSRSRLRAIQTVAKMLLESPKLEQAPDINWVRKSCNDPDDFSELECAAIVRIVGTLRDYVPKRREKHDGGTSPPEHNAATMIRAVLLSNHLLRYTGYADFTRQFSPAPSISTLHPIPLSAAGIYEVLCPSSDLHFDVKIDETHPITSVEHANKNQLAVFANFFDLKKIEKVCTTYGLEFANR
ncbi:hypothetical protein BGX30_008465, partial [Mortierella sp. GBA39]